MSSQSWRKIARFVLASFATAGVAAISGCAWIPPVSAPTPEPEPEPPVPETDVAWQELIPEQAPRLALAAGESVLPPVLVQDEVVLPEFPPSLLGTDDFSVQILARVVINADGEVERVLFNEAAQDDALAPFHTSIRSAVRQWRFLPMIVVKAPQPTAKGGIRRQHVPSPVSLWYQFEFTLKNGEADTTLREQPMT